MILVRFTMPLIYTLLVCGAWGIVFNKKMEHSLAPAFFLQIILMLVTGMLFRSITAAVFIMAALSLGTMIFTCIKVKSIRPLINEYLSIGTFFIVFFYIVIYIKNYGCTFSGWDEFSHWGLFVKEMFRTDALYCTSQATISHKDYVPAISLFETLWCKLSLRYSEAETYRGIQMIQMAMLLPAVTVGCEDGKKLSAGRAAEYFMRIVMVFGLPLFLGFFYHTILKDWILGVMIYYCMYLVISQKESAYKVFTLILSLTVLVLTKMTALLFLPMIVVFYFVWTLKFENEQKTVTVKKALLQSGMQMLIPMALWMIFNKYADHFIAQKSEIQSYSSVGLDDIINVLTHNGAISYQRDVETEFFKSLLFTGVFHNLSFVLFFVLSVVGLLLIARSQKNDTDRKKINLINLWIVLATLAYTMAMLYLYLTSFTEAEARGLASFTRYMQTDVMMIIFMICYVVIAFSNQTMRILKIVTTAIVIENTCMFIGFTELIPGALIGEKQEFSDEAVVINENTPTDCDILFISYGDEGAPRVQYVMRYQLLPRALTWISPRSALSDADVSEGSVSLMGQDELFDVISKNDLVYLWNVDDRFFEEYGSVFDEPENYGNHRVYAVTIVGDKIRLTDLTE